MRFKTEQTLKDSNGRPIVGAIIEDYRGNFIRQERRFEIVFALYSEVDGKRYFVDFLKPIEITERNVAGEVHFQDESTEQVYFTLKPEEFFGKFGISPYSEEAKENYQAHVLKHGKPSIYALNQFFSTSEDMLEGEIVANFSMVEDWVLHTQKIFGKTLKEWGFETVE